MLHALNAAVVLAQETISEEEPEGIDLLIPETNELIAGIIAFAIIFAVVLWWVMPQMKKILEARQEAIRGPMEEAETAKTEAESLLADYKSQLAEARQEADQIVEEARQAAEAVGAEIKARADAEAAEIVRKAREEAVGERERVADDIRSEVVSLSLDVAEKVVSHGIDRDGQRDLIDSYIADLERM